MLKELAAREASNVTTAVWAAMVTKEGPGQHRGLIRHEPDLFLVHLYPGLNPRCDTSLWSLNKIGACDVFNL